MISLNSSEFYTLAFVVVMALVGLIFVRREKQPPSTYIIQLATVPVGEEQSESSPGGNHPSPQCGQSSTLGETPDVLCLEPMEGGRIRLARTGLALGVEETINLVITVQEETCSIVEKKGLRRRSAVPVPVTGEAMLGCLRPGTKYRVRYESQVTSTWASFTLDTASPVPIEVPLKY